MAISFKLLNYTDAQNIKEWEQVNQNIPLPKSDNVLRNFLIVIVSIFILALIIGIFAGFFAFFQVMFLLAFIIFANFSNIFLSGNSPQSRPKNFQHFGETIHFSKDTFYINSAIPSLNVTFVYTDFSDIIFCFKEFEGENIAIFRGKLAGEIHQYTLKIADDLQKQDLVQVLSYLYEKGLNITELDEYGKKMYLLKTLTSERKLNIEHKYLDLIDEIGKNQE